eukprot:TRINITY_DN594_c0_g1_i1.p2 TRINITY_DN594_c0_g1~~TRINITY_DN594_c0_g1_i1.p2  ORF type:complete len:68 (+),score=8.31 TRINITY_DN594_c0_g1_i1:573-776(+)
MAMTTSATAVVITMISHGKDPALPLSAVIVVVARTVVALIVVPAVGTTDADADVVEVVVEPVVVRFL